KLYDINGEKSMPMESDYNLIYNTEGENLKISGLPGTESFEDWQKLGYDRHSVIADPLFVDPENDDYSLRPESPAFKLGFKPIDLSNVGLRGLDEGLKITMPAEAPAPQAICFKISVPDGFLENFSEEALLSEEEMPAYWVLPEVGATARIDWYCATLDQVEDIAWEGKLMEALNLGGLDVTINGVPFKGEKDMRKARYITNTLALSMNDTVLYNQKVPSLAPLLNSQAYGGTEGENIRLELTGLTPGERYIVQFMVSDYRNDYPFLALNIDSHVARINRRETVYAHNDALVFSGIFTADTETKAIEAKAWTWKLSKTNFDPHFSAYQLRELEDNE
ncbi:unnamed protein product, partial [marine sediment metagenome]